MFDLCDPMKGCSVTQSRHLFLEGDLKFKDNSSKADVHCFLLTDILLICKPITKRGHGALKVSLKDVIFMFNGDAWLI